MKSTFPSSVPTETFGHAAEVSVNEIRSQWADERNPEVGVADRVIKGVPAQTTSGTTTLEKQLLKMILTKTTSRTMALTLIT